MALHQDSNNTTIASAIGAAIYLQPQSATPPASLSTCPVEIKTLIMQQIVDCTDCSVVYYSDSNLNPHIKVYEQRIISQADHDNMMDNADENGVLQNFKGNGPYDTPLQKPHWLWGYGGNNWNDWEAPLTDEPAFTNVNDLTIYTNRLRPILQVNKQLSMLVRQLFYKRRMILSSIPSLVTFFTNISPDNCAFIRHLNVNWIGIGAHKVMRKIVALPSLQSLTLHVSQAGSAAGLRRYDGVQTLATSAPVRVLFRNLRGVKLEVVVYGQLDGGSAWVKKLKRMAVMPRHEV